MQLDLPDHHGNPEQPEQDAHPGRDIRFYHGAFPLLQTESTTMAEFHQVALLPHHGEAIKHQEL